MIDSFQQAIQQKTQKQNVTQQKISQPVQSTPSAQSPGLKRQKQELEQLLKDYIKQSVSIHRQRLERVEEVNQILHKQYRAIDTDLDKVVENKTIFNKQLDGMIGILKQVDRVEAGIIECEKNAKLVYDMINLIEKKMRVKLQKKIENLEKLKKNKQKL